MHRYRTVMIVDDSEMDSFLNKMILETHDYAKNILTYSNPQAALNYFKNLSQENDLNDKVPEVVFLDINMPIMSGFQFLEEFEKLPVELISGVRFYMISSSEDPEDLEKMKKYERVIKYLYKPLDKNQL